MKKIPLTKGLFALVDDADYGWLSKFKWHTHPGSGGTPYARGAWHPERGNTLMHRLILNTKPGMDTDHLDRNGLNNQRANLRECTRSENKMNTDLRSNNKSGVYGVCWVETRQKWQVTKCGKFLGRFDSLAEAKQTYERAPYSVPE